MAKGLPYAEHADNWQTSVLPPAALRRNDHPKAKRLTAEQCRALAMLADAGCHCDRSCAGRGSAVVDKTRIAPQAL
jgi:hypothetical protein